MLILPKSSPKICYLLVKYFTLQKNIVPVEDSMADAKNKVVGVENNYRSLRSEEKGKQK